MSVKLAPFLATVLSKLQLPRGIACRFIHWWWRRTGSIKRGERDRQTERETDRERDRQTERETDRQRERQTDRPTDRQTDRRTKTDY